MYAEGKVDMTSLYYSVAMAAVWQPGGKGIYVKRNKKKENKQNKILILYTVQWDYGKQLYRSKVSMFRLFERKGILVI